MKQDYSAYTAKKKRLVCYQSAFYQYLKSVCVGVDKAKSIRKIMEELGFNRRKEDFQNEVMGPLKKITCRIGSCHRGIFFIETKEDAYAAVNFYKSRVLQEMHHMKLISEEFNLSLTLETDLKQMDLFKQLAS